MHSCSLHSIDSLRILLPSSDALLYRAPGGALPQNLVRAQDAAAEEQASRLGDVQQQQQQERVSIWTDLLAKTSADAAAVDTTPHPGLARLPDADAMQEAVESATGGGSAQPQPQEETGGSQAPDAGGGEQQQGAHQPQMQSLQAWLSARASRKRGAAKASAGTHGAAGAPANATVGAAAQGGEPEPLEWVWARVCGGLAAGCPLQGPRITLTLSCGYILGGIHSVTERCVTPGNAWQCSHHASASCSRATRCVVPPPTMPTCHQPPSLRFIALRFPPRPRPAFLPPWPYPLQLPGVVDGPILER